MFKINAIKEESHIFEFLNKRGLVPQYKKSKIKILNGLYG